MRCSSRIVGVSSEHVQSRLCSTGSIPDVPAPVRINHEKPTSLVVMFAVVGYWSIVKVGPGQRSNGSGVMRGRKNQCWTQFTKTSISFPVRPTMGGPSSSTT